jgi:hypothetical protein
MKKIGITGHQQIDEPSHWQWVGEEIVRIIERFSSPITGISSLATGADQLFAKIILEHGSSLVAIIPFDTYEHEFSEERDRLEYKRLLSKASKVEVLHKKKTDEASFLQAGYRVVNLSDILIAVWDGKPAAGLGGTGDIVEYAKKLKKRIIHLNPDSCNMSVLN